MSCPRVFDATHPSGMRCATFTEQFSPWGEWVGIVDPEWLQAVVGVIVSMGMLTATVIVGAMILIMIGRGALILWHRAAAIRSASSAKAQSR